MWYRKFCSLFGFKTETQTRTLCLVIVNFVDFVRNILSNFYLYFTVSVLIKIFSMNLKINLFFFLWILKSVYKKVNFYSFVVSFWVVAEGLCSYGDRVIRGMRWSLLNGWRRRLLVLLGLVLVIATRTWPERWAHSQLQLFQGVDVAFRLRELRPIWSSTF